MSFSENYWQGCSWKLQPVNCPLQLFSLMSFSENCWQRRSGSLQPHRDPPLTNWWTHSDFELWEFSHPICSSQIIVERCGRCAVLLVVLISWSKVLLQIYSTTFFNIVSQFRLSLITTVCWVICHNLILHVCLTNWPQLFHITTTNAITSLTPISCHVWDIYW